MSTAGHGITPTVFFQRLKGIEKRLEGNLPACQQGLSLSSRMMKNTIFYTSPNCHQSYEPLAISGGKREKSDTSKKKGMESAGDGLLRPTTMEILPPKCVQATHFP